MRATTLLALALLLLAAPLAADGPPWVPLGPGGGHVDSIKVSPVNPNVLYAVTWTGAYRSLNAGASWVEIEGLGLVDLVVPDPSQPATVDATVALGKRVFKSVDFGVTWTPSAPLVLPGFEEIGGLVVDPSRRSRLYLTTTTDMVWRSDDGGASWRQASLGLSAGGGNLTRVAVSRRPAGTAFVGTSSGLFRTTNAGNSWSRVGRSLPASQILEVIVSPSDPRIVYASLESGFYRSQDGGASWAQAADRVVFGLKVHPKVPRTIFAFARGGGLLRSKDSGRTWAPLGPAPEVDIRSFDIHSGRTGDALWLGTHPDGSDVGGVRVSTDNGVRWAVRNRGLHDLTVQEVGADAEGNLLAGTQGQGLFRRTNPRFPPLWTRTHAGLPSTPEFASIGQIVNAGPGIFFATFLSGLPTTTPLWRTTDGGRTWSAEPGPPLEGPFGLIPDPDLEGTLYALSRQGLARTQDGGESWTPLTRPTFECASGGLAVAPSSPPDARVLYAAGAKPLGSSCQFSLPQVFRSSDGGASWVDVSAGAELAGHFAGPVAVDPLDANVVYMATRGFSVAGPFGLWKSTDGGATWTRSLPARAVHIVVPPIPGRVYAAVDTGSSSPASVFRSDDGGATWRLWNEGISATQVLDLVLDPGDPSRLYAATDGGVWVLEETD
ncbi:MAG TPA: hypothetical protein VLE27_06065 [Thermoanaerobaculia bacterium]|nr:hypothetical protein [Thermoanaerobaculia bacterium]